MKRISAKQPFVSLSSDLTRQIGRILKKERYPNCQITAKALLTIIDMISSYHEEGRALYPEILLTTDIIALFKAVPSSSILSIGKKPLSLKSFSVAIKACAPLATDGWNIFIERRSNTVEFGLVRAGDSMISLTPKELLFTGDEHLGVPVVKIEQLGAGIVELKASCGSTLHVHYSGAVNSFEAPDINIQHCISDICKDVSVKLKPAVETFYKRIFLSVTKDMHGSLAIVVKRRGKIPIRGIEDGLWLTRKINVRDVIDTYLKTKDVLAGSNLTSLAAIIRGMMWHDGITVFDTSASILAYNVFARPFTTANIRVASSSSGGARRRTYDMLCSRLGQRIIGCYFLSHDGNSDYKRG